MLCVNKASTFRYDADYFQPLIHQHENGTTKSTHENDNVFTDLWWDMIQTHEYRSVGCFAGHYSITNTRCYYNVLHCIIEALDRLQIVLECDWIWWCPKYSPAFQYDLDARYSYVQQVWCHSVTSQSCADVICDVGKLCVLVTIDIKSCWIKFFTPDLQFFHLSIMSIVTRAIRI